MTALTCLLLLAAANVPATTAAPASAPAPAKRYVCPGDGTRSDHPGPCPACGMDLVEEPADMPGKTKVAILVFDGVEIIDFAGPYEVFGAAGFDVYTVAATKAPVVTSMGLKVVPAYSFADVPAPDIVVVPGGSVKQVRSDPAVLKWVSNQATRAPHTMSVCNGAFTLASAGLLDGLTVTTTAHLIDQLRRELPQSRVVADKRFVDNGKILTTGGLSAGIDGALELVSQLRGKGYAQGVALGIEYDWRPDQPFTPAILADRLLPDLDLDLTEWQVDAMEGTTDRWNLALRSRSAHDRAQLMAHLDAALIKGGWKRTASSAGRSDWSFAGSDGKPWRGTLSIEDRSGAAAVKLAIASATSH